MKDKQLLATVGLPRSGKSTWARKAASEYGCPVVNPDAIRESLHGQKFYQPAEHLVWYFTHLMVESLFKAGHHLVILDATNTKREYRDQWRSEKWDVAFVVFDTPPQECVERYEKAPQESADNLPEIIVMMAEEYEPLEEDEQKYCPIVP